MLDPDLFTLPHSHLQYYAWPFSGKWMSRRSHTTPKVEFGVKMSTIKFSTTLLSPFLQFLSRWVFIHILTQDTIYSHIKVYIKTHRDKNCKKGDKSVVENLIVLILTPNLTFGVVFEGRLIHLNAKNRGFENGF